MTTSVNKYDGEFKLKIYGIDYPMRLNARVYGEFKSETGRDLNSIFADVINELNRLRVVGAMDKEDDCAASEMMAGLCAIIDMEYAAWLFYLSAKAIKNSMVSFEEIQEAVLLEGVSQNKTCSVDGEIVQSYPNLFLKFTIFALDIGGNEEEIKKPQNSKPSLLEKLRYVLSI